MKTPKNARIKHAISRMVTSTHLIPIAPIHGVRAKIKPVLKLFRTTVTPTKASPIT